MGKLAELRRKFAAMSDDEKRATTARLATLMLDSAERDLSSAATVLEQWDHAWRETAPVLDAARAEVLMHGDCDCPLCLALAALTATPPVEPGRAVLVEMGRGEGTR